MNKILRLVILAISLPLTQVVAQDKTDILYTNDDAIKVNVTEVTEATISYTYPGETMVNKMNVSKVNKIVFASGRTQTFGESVNYPAVRNALDWEYVTLTQVEADVKGLHRLDNVSAKAKAMIGWTGVGKMENRATQKLKIEAAMNGANVVYITQQSSNTRTQQSTSSSVVSGVAYSNRLPVYQTLSDIFSGKKDFRYIEKYVLGNNSMDVSVKPQNGGMVTFSKVEQAGDLVYLHGAVPNEKPQKFRVSYFDDELLVLVYRDNKHITNLVFQI